MAKLDVDQAWVIGLVEDGIRGFWVLIYWSQAFKVRGDSNTERQVRGWASLEMIPNTVCACPPATGLQDGCLFVCHQLVAACRAPGVVTVNLATIHQRPWLQARLQFECMNNSIITWKIWAQPTVHMLLVEPFHKRMTPAVLHTAFHMPTVLHQV